MLGRIEIGHVHAHFIGGALIATAMRRVRQSVQFGLRGVAAAAHVIKNDRKRTLALIFCALSARHCEERSDEAIQTAAMETVWIASLRSQ
ncbi:hypothetical protein [Bradyrhizobium sp. SBR1B]|uniref:hypothetical protein n=1 Tax=Bradyrhizobium sp. SBR1B TaxID=2663836 RepID=UPI0016062549|nr:hypothetical protein [Bradyrhizobium sp. SBR1B]MBB4379688.1 putative membrane protein [Bradyrhizobium sp. SBR1B]